MSKWFLAVSCAALMSAAGVLRAADDKWVRIVHSETGKVLAIADDSDEGGADAVVSKAGDSQSQQWKVEKDGQQVKLVNRKSGKALDVNENSADEGARIIQWDEKEEDNDNQRWSWVGEGKNRQIKSKSSGLVLDVTAEGKVVQKKADEKAKGQMWHVEDVKS